MFPLVIVFIVNVVISQSTVPLYPFEHKTTLNGTYYLNLRWNIEDSRINFELEINAKGYVPFEYALVGFTHNRKVECADGCLWSIKQDYMTDISINDDGTIIKDDQQDCVFQGSVCLPDGRWVVRWQRVMDTCDDANDMTINVVYINTRETIRNLIVLMDNCDVHSIRSVTRETTQLLFVIGTSTRPNVLSDMAYRAIEMDRLVQDFDCITQLPSNYETMIVRAQNITVPDKATTYWCTLTRLPNMKQKHHIYEPLIQSGNEHIVHHMEVYLCSEPTHGGAIQNYNNECLSGKMPPKLTSCKHVIGAWAMGAKPFVYPKEAGLAIGGDDYYPYAVLEIHYNNHGLTDTSGIKFFYTSELRPHDAGILETGLMYSDAMAIPPQLDIFPLTGYCVPQCSERGFTSSGINVFASQLHSHDSGRRIRTAVIRDGVLIGYVSRDDHYSSHWQEIRPLKPHVRLLPGDTLATTCDYDTSKREKVTLGGYGIEDEMCVNYMHYYPKQRLEVCKSAVNNKTLHSFLQRHAPAWSHSKPISVQMRHVQFDGRIIDELKRVYTAAPLNVQCLGHSGKQLKGKWTSVPHPRAHSWLAHEPRHCERETIY